MASTTSTDRLRTTIVVDDTTLERVDAIVGLLRSHPIYGSLGVTRTSVVRMALPYGLEALERRLRKEASDERKAGGKL